MLTKEDYRVRITYAAQGEAGPERFAEEDAERILRIWNGSHPELGPLASFRPDTGTVTVTISDVGGYSPIGAEDLAVQYARDVGLSFGIVGLAAIPTRYDD